MNYFFCCLRTSSREKGDADLESMEPFRPLSPNPECGCCQNPFQRRKHRDLLRTSPECCDAAVDTEIDFGIILHDLEKVDADNFEGKDHKFASLQFDTKPGKVKYIEGSQVFYVEVRDKRLNPHRPNSNPSDKSVSDEEEAHMESDLSTDILWETKSEGRRRYMGSDKNPHRKNSTGKTPVIVCAPNKWSPTASEDSLSDKNKVPNRVYLREIDEEHYVDTSTPNQTHKSSHSMDGYNIGGGQISIAQIEPDDEQNGEMEAEKKVSRPSSAESVPSSFQDNENKSGRENDLQDQDGSGFADISDQSVDDISSPISNTIILYMKNVESKESSEQSTLISEENNESLFPIKTVLPIENTLTEDPSRLLMVDRASSMIIVKEKDQDVRRLNSCPNVTQQKEEFYRAPPSPFQNEELEDTENICSQSEDIEAVVRQSECSEKMGFSVETQTSEKEVDLDRGTAGNYKPSVSSVYTESECDSIDFDANEGKTTICQEKVDTSTATSKQSTTITNSDSSSSTGSDFDCSFGDSESSSNSEELSKKDGPSNSSDSFCSTCSSSPKSVEKRHRKLHSDSDEKTKTSSSSSLEGSSSNSDISCVLSSSTSTCSSSTTSKQSPSPRAGGSFHLPICNG